MGLDYLPKGMLWAPQLEALWAMLLDSRTLDRLLEVSQVELSFVFVTNSCQNFLKGLLILVPQVLLLVPQQVQMLAITLGTD